MIFPTTSESVLLPFPTSFYLWNSTVQSHNPSCMPATCLSYIEFLSGSKRLAGSIHANSVIALSCCQVFPYGHLVWWVFSVYWKQFCIMDQFFFHHSVNPLVLRLRHAHFIILTVFIIRTSMSFLIALFKSWIVWILCSSRFPPLFLMLHFLKSKSYL